MQDAVVCTAKACSRPVCIECTVQLTGKVASPLQQCKHSGITERRQGRGEVCISLQPFKHRWCSFSHIVRNHRPHYQCSNPKVSVINSSSSDLNGIRLGENSDKALTDTSKFVFGLTFRPLSQLRSSSKDMRGDLRPKTNLLVSVSALSEQFVCCNLQ